MKTVTIEKRKEFRRMERAIVEEWHYMGIGYAFGRIRNERYYRDILGYRTFADYCRVRWGMSYRHVNRIIAARRVLENIAKIGGDIVRTPRTEREARPLARLTPGQQREAWSIALETAGRRPVETWMVVEAVEKVAPRKVRVSRGIQVRLRNLMLLPMQAVRNMAATVSRIRLSRAA